MKVYARIRDLSLNIVSGADQLTIPIGISFDHSGTAVNDGMNAYVSPPNLVTELLIDSALKSAIASFVNANYSGCSVSASDVFLFGGVIVPLL